MKNTKVAAYINLGTLLFLVLVGFFGSSLNEWADIFLGLLLVISGIWTSVAIIKDSNY